MWPKQIIHLAVSCVSLIRNSSEAVYLSDEHGLSIELGFLSVWWLGSKKNKQTNKQKTKQKKKKLSVVPRRCSSTLERQVWLISFEKLAEILT